MAESWAAKALRTGVIPTPTRRQIAAREKAAAKARARAEANARVSAQGTLAFDRPPKQARRVWPDGLPPTAVYAGATVTRAQLRGTITLLSYYRAFLASDCERCKNPDDRPFYVETMTRADARRRLSFLVNVAISRKGGMPDVACRKQDHEYQVQMMRDCRAVRDRVNHRVSVHRFETRAIRDRYSHLLSRRDDL